MTNKSAKQFMEETKTEELVKKIIEHFNGESYADTKKFLSVLSFYLMNNLYLDADLAKSVIENGEDDD